MKILFLTQYFPPETGAPQNRLFDLAMRLTKLNVDVTVLTAMPNYPKREVYEGYRNKKYDYEIIQGIKIHRTYIYVSKSKSIISRLRNYFSFVFSSRMCSSKMELHYDFIFCESPPLFLGYSAMYLARKKTAKLIFNVSDLWPESAEKLGVVTNKWLLKMAYHLEKRIYKKSIFVTGQTKGICENISSRFPDVKTFWLPNGVEPENYNPDKIETGNWKTENSFNANDKLFVYAGIIGIAQGLEVMLKAAKYFSSYPDVKFLIIGEGPEKIKLLQLKSKLGLENVRFIHHVPKEKMPLVLKNCFAAIIPLRKLDLFKGAIPSKIFECLAMELPVILGVDGEARNLFVKEGKCALYFEPENEMALTEVIRSLIQNSTLAHELGSIGRKYTMQNFNREKVAYTFYQLLLQHI